MFTNVGSFSNFSKNSIINQPTSWWSVLRLLHASLVLINPSLSPPMPHPVLLSPSSLKPLALGFSTQSRFLHVTCASLSPYYIFYLRWKMWMSRQLLHSHSFCQVSCYPLLSSSPLRCCLPDSVPRVPHPSFDFTHSLLSPLFKCPSPRQQTIFSFLACTCVPC